MAYLTDLSEKELRDMLHSQRFGATACEEIQRELAKRGTAKPAPKEAPPEASRTPLQPKGPNQTESDFRDQILEPRKAAGISRGHHFERITFRLAPGLTYTPDFVEELADGSWWIWETKGGQIWEDAAKSFKMAAELWPQMRWTMVQRKSRKKPWEVVYDRGRNTGALPAELVNTSGRR